MNWLWVFPLFFFGSGIALIVYGILYNKKDYERTKKYGTSLGSSGVADTIVGVIAEIIFVLFIDWFVRFLPKWLIKTFLILIGLGLFATGIIIFQNIP
jgi:membrane associated rhomboid family serine protease